MPEPEPVHVTIFGSPADPRTRSPEPDGTVVHHAPPAHPDDICVVDGIPVTSPSRTLIDLADVVDRDELRSCFQRALDLGLVDFRDLKAARSRVEWRPSLQTFDEVMCEVFESR